MEPRTIEWASHSPAGDPAGQREGGYGIRSGAYGKRRLPGIAAIPGKSPREGGQRSPNLAAQAACRRRRPPRRYLGLLPPGRSDQGLLHDVAAPRAGWRRLCRRGGVVACRRLIVLVTITSMASE